MSVPAPPLQECFRTFGYIGLNSFGGPAGQIAVMHRVLVEEKRWLSEARFLHALNFCMLLPGPEAMQLATYSGWLLHGTRGGILAGLLFVLPGAAAVLLLSMLYAAFHDTVALASVFLGLRAAVIVIIAEAVVRIGRKTLKTTFSFAVAAAAFAGLLFLHLPYPVVIAGAACVGYLRSRSHSAPPEKDTPGAGTAGRIRSSAITVAVWGGLWICPIALLLFAAGPGSVWFQIAWLFSKAAVLTFGGAYAVLAYLAQQAVTQYGWLTPGGMADALALAETTPGPLILVTEFVGFFAAHQNSGILPGWMAGILGALLTLWVTFVPCFLWIFLGAPYMEQLRRNQALAGALAAITAAVVGVILQLGVWFALHALFEHVDGQQFGAIHWLSPQWVSFRWPVAVLTAAAAIAAFRFHAGMLSLIAGCGALGGLWYAVAG
ncbi:MAG: chromate efflux transporter [Candidatus Hydrogenedens sp.]|nr:chromate efflux transporter [Candidatus Hydrogenedens sp.]